jgi:exodeoxyribonuclease V gamma subunit
MLELTYSNDTDALLERLSARVQAERAAGKGPWEATHLVVPNPYLKEYLRLGLARRLGVAANLHFTYLAGLWKDWLVDGSRSLLDFDLLRAGLLAVLGEERRLGQEVLKPVRSYLGSGGTGLKQVQLASELAKVFEEYQLSRPDWIEAWRQGKAGGGPEPGAEAWQAALWREGLQLLDAASPAGSPVRHLTLMELVRGHSFEGMRLPRTIHAFGLSHVAQAYQEVYRAFGPLPDTTLHIYALNPCEEFWEDLSTDRKAVLPPLPTREGARLGSQNPAAEDLYELTSRGPRALRLWGRPGRENIRLLNEVSDCDFTPAFQRPAQPTLLGRMQRDILLYQEPDPAEASEPDGSIRCLACPSPRREAEAVATELWRLVESHPATAPLRFSDIAVVVPAGQQEAYRAHLEAAFHDAQRIPMVQSDRALPIMRQTLEAVRLLLDLPTSGLTRAALLAVLQHPGLQRRFSDLDASAWGRWCETFGIVRGADQAAWAGTYLERDVLNWDQGLKRLALGAFLTEDLEFELGDEAYRADGAKEAGPAAIFTALVRGLCADAQELLRTREEPRLWSRRLWRFLEKWLQVDDGDEAEAVLRALDRIRTFLGRSLERVPAQLALPALEFTAARHLALEALERLENEQPANLSKGVVIATYATVRAIPFRAVFLMGLGEGSYPTRNQRSALDLRSKERRAGDVSQTEKEKYLFLEMLLSARDHLVLSYVALDELSGETFEPSGLFKEFRALLGEYLTPAWALSSAGDPCLETHPLRRFDPAYFPAWFPEAGSNGLHAYSAIAEAEARALWLGEEARRRHVPMPLSLGELQVPAADLGTLRQALASPGSAGLPPDKGLLRIALGDLKTFLECPLSGAAAARMGLRSRELEDRSALEDEPFESGFLEAWGLQREVTLGALAGSETPEAVYARCLHRLQSQGAVPFGIFSEVEAGKNLIPIRAWVRYLRSEGQGGAPATWRLGANRSRSDQVDHPRPPLVLDLMLEGQPRKVELTGKLRVQLQGTLFLETGKPPAESGMAALRKKALGAYVDHLVLACVDPDHQGHRARFVYTESKTPKGAKVAIQECSIDFPAVAKADAEAQLRAWVEDLLTGDHAMLLPIEAVLAKWKDGKLTAATIQAYVDAQLEDGPRAHFSTLNGPVPDPTRFPPPPEPMPLVRARLGSFLDAAFGAAAEEQL